MNTVKNKEEGRGAPFEHPSPTTTHRVLAKFKSQEELDSQRQQFINGAEDARKDSIGLWAPQSLKKLSLEDLLDRLEKIDGQAALLKWRVFAAIRALFPSDKLYGQRLAELRAMPEYAGLIGAQQDCHRAAAAGRFCEKHGITDLAQAGILKSAVYALSRPANLDVSDAIYKQIKKKSLPLAEVERLVMQAKSLKGEVMQEPARIDYDNVGNTIEPEEKVRHLRQHIVLENGRIPGLVEEQQGEALTDLMANAFAEAEAVTKVEYEAPEEDFEEEVEPVHLHIERPGCSQDTLSNATDTDLLLELASRRAVGLTAEQMASEILLLSDRFGLSNIKLIPIMQLCTRHLQSASYYKKQVGGAA